MTDNDTIAAILKAGRDIPVLVAGVDNTATPESVYYTARRKSGSLVLPGTGGPENFRLGIRGARPGAQSMNNRCKFNKNHYYYMK